MPKSVNITINDDGTFSVQAGEGNVKNFQPHEMIFALEEIVFAFREKRIRLTTETAAYDKFRKSLKDELQKNMQPEEFYANGGLGNMNLNPLNYIT